MYVMYLRIELAHGTIVMVCFGLLPDVILDRPFTAVLDGHIGSRACMNDIPYKL